MPISVNATTVTKGHIEKPITSTRTSLFADPEKRGVSSGSKGVLRRENGVRESEEKQRDALLEMNAVDLSRPFHLVSSTLLARRPLSPLAFLPQQRGSFNRLTVGIPTVANLSTLVN